MKKGTFFLLMGFFGILFFLGAFFFQIDMAPNDLPKNDISMTSASEAKIRHRYINLEGLSLFYREAGNPAKPTILLMHGYPTSSRMFVGLMEELKDDFYLLAPDFPGFGYSEQPSIFDFEYSFEHYAEIIQEFLSQKGVENYFIYLMDYGAPVGLLIAEKEPQRVQGLIVQNGNMYDEGLGKLFDKAKKVWDDPSEENVNAIFKARGNMKNVVWEYTNGTLNPNQINPDNWVNDFNHLLREGNLELQVQLVIDYGNNVKKYPDWQEYLRTYQPPTLIVWGENDEVFLKEGALAFKNDLNEISIHFFDTGHFALEEFKLEISELITKFIQDKI